MRTSENGVNIIKQFEGCILHAYDDGCGNLTVGYGHCARDVFAGEVITQADAEQILYDDLKRFEDNVNKYVKQYDFNQNQFDALVSFAFNIGSVDELLRNGTLAKNEITERMLLYCHVGDEVVQGLVDRRQAEVNLYNTPTGTVKDISYYAHLVCDTINGKYGIDEQRKQALGRDYKIVQGCINTMWDYIGKNIK